MPFVGELSLTVDFDQMWSKLLPSLEDFVMQQTLTECGPNWAPHRRALSRSRLWPNVAQIVPLLEGLCHAADFNQMWSKICPLLEDFVMQWTLTKCGPKCGTCQRTLSHSRLWPNVVQTCAPWWRTLFCYGVWPRMDQQLTHHQKKHIPNKRILFVDQCGTETAVSDYVAMWSISVLTSLNKEMTDLVSITWQMTNDVDCT